MVRRDVSTEPPALPPPPAPPPVHAVSARADTARAARPANRPELLKRDIFISIDRCAVCGTSLSAEGPRSWLQSDRGPGGSPFGPAPRALGAAYRGPRSPPTFPDGSDRPEGGG